MVRERMIATAAKVATEAPTEEASFLACESSLYVAVVCWLAFSGTYETIND